MLCHKVLPVPSFPAPPCPQHFIEESSNTAQVWAWEACIEEAEYTEPA